MFLRLKTCLWLALVWNVNLIVLANYTTHLADDIYQDDGGDSDEATEDVATLAPATENPLTRQLSLKLPTECETPNGDPAWCIEIQECPNLLNLVGNNNAKPFLIASKCGPGNEDARKPKVCCGKYDHFRSNNNITVDDSLVFPKKCGNQRVIMRSRILGGSQASLGEFPWMARLIHKNKNGYRSVGCSAFLIHTKYVMTAAHCVHENFVKFRGPVFSVILGEHNTETKVDCNPTGTYCADPLQISRVAKVIVHPGYDFESPGHYNDIALIHLKKGARITEFVQPICLQKNQGQVPDEYVISGWGKTESESFSTVKMKVEIPSFNKYDCIEKYSSLNIDLVDSQICAGGEPQKDSCSGDSGGPLMFENGTEWYASGIVSYGIGCGVDGWPGVYTNISSFIPWVKQEIVKNSLVNPKSPKPHKKKNNTTTERFNGS